MRLALSTVCSVHHERAKLLELLHIYIALNWPQTATASATTEWLWISLIESLKRKNENGNTYKIIDHYMHVHIYMFAHCTLNALCTWDSLDFLSQITHPLPFQAIGFHFHIIKILLFFARTRALFSFCFDVAGLLFCIQVNALRAFVLICCWILHFSSNSLGAVIILRFAMRCLISHQYGVILPCACTFRFSRMNIKLRRQEKTIRDLSPLHLLNISFFSSSFFCAP